MDVTALLPVDATKFLSPLKDGYRPSVESSHGKELTVGQFTDALQTCVYRKICW
jgi:hypothetical protein